MGSWGQWINFNPIKTLLFHTALIGLGISFPGIFNSLQSELRQKSLIFLDAFTKPQLNWRRWNPTNCEQSGIRVRQKEVWPDKIVFGHKKSTQFDSVWVWVEGVCNVWSHQLLTEDWERILSNWTPSAPSDLYYRDPEPAVITLIHSVRIDLTLEIVQKQGWTLPSWEYGCFRQFPKCRAGDKIFLMEWLRDKLRDLLKLLFTQDYVLRSWNF